MFFLKHHQLNWDLLPISIYLKNLTRTCLDGSQLDTSIGHVPEETYTVLLSKAKIMKEGRDLTLLGLEMTIHHLLEAVEELEEKGIDAELIDLPSIIPLDKETILKSVEKTSRLLVVDEGYKSYGITAEIADIMAEEGHYNLETLIKRLVKSD